MGVLISRFRTKKSTIEVLEQIDKDTTKLQKLRYQSQQRQKKFIGRLIIYSILLYIVSAVVFYFLYFPDNWRDRLIYSTPLLIFPFLVWMIKRILHWYFVKRIAGTDVALNELRNQKKQILEDVMETETYKKAKEILEKFDPSRFKSLEPLRSPVAPKPASTGSVVRQRTVRTVQPTQTRVITQVVTPPTFRPVTPAIIKPPATAIKAPIKTATPAVRNVTPALRAPAPAMRAQTPAVKPQTSTIMGITPAGRGPMGAPRGQTPAVRGPGSSGTLVTPRIPRQQAPIQPKIIDFVGSVTGPPPGPPLPLPRPAPPKERSIMDRLLEYLVGDGPESQYALICRNCHSHNGMALKEEFEYITFRCGYCHTINPARKYRYNAPRLEDQISPEDVMTVYPAPETTPASRNTQPVATGARPKERDKDASNEGKERKNAEKDEKLGKNRGKVQNEEERKEERKIERNETAGNTVKAKDDREETVASKTPDDISDNILESSSDSEATSQHSKSGDSKQVDSAPVSVSGDATQGSRSEEEDMALRSRSDSENASQLSSVVDAKPKDVNQSATNEIEGGDVIETSNAGGVTLVQKAEKMPFISKTEIEVKSVTSDSQFKEPHSNLEKATYRSRTQEVEQSEALPGSRTQEVEPLEAVQGSRTQEVERPEAIPGSRTQEVKQPEAIQGSRTLEVEQSEISAILSGLNLDAIPFADSDSSDNQNVKQEGMVSPVDKGQTNAVSRDS